MRLLLLSNSTNHGRGFLEHVDAVLADYLHGVRNLTFVPFARADHDAYTARVSEALKRYDITVTGAHDSPDPISLMQGSDAIFVGGGNTFRLLKSLQDRGLLTEIAQAVRSGTRYLGASAGTNIAAPTIRTTNDMPIVQPDSFASLGLLPFQINPHYIDTNPNTTYAGESRADRLAEFLEENDVPVLGLREGTYLNVVVTEETRTATIGGTSASDDARGPAVLFTSAAEPTECHGNVGGLFYHDVRYDAHYRAGS